MIDNSKKRSSAINPFCPWRSSLPFPDGLVTHTDRRHVDFGYSIASIFRKKYIPHRISRGDDIIRLRPQRRRIP